MEETIDELREQVANLRAAAASAAGTAVTAIERIQELQVVVDAAVAWRQGGGYDIDRDDDDDEAGVARAVDAHLSRVRSRS